MDLRTYLKANRGSGVAIAKFVEVHPVMVSQWANGTKAPIPVERCTAIERATDGAVRRWDLRPHDWHEHWPELKRAKGAPQVATAD
jgi:DNA-binding transcriptional regulator YdaS (Cro superfamily)